VSGWFYLPGVFPVFFQRLRGLDSFDRSCRAFTISPLAGGRVQMNRVPIDACVVLSMHDPERYVPDFSLVRA
jgi:hypothetical protein